MGGIGDELRKGPPLARFNHVAAPPEDLGEGYVAQININLAVWGALVVLLILAQVFKEGTRLREEEKMTI